MSAKKICDSLPARPIGVRRRQEWLRARRAERGEPNPLEVVRRQVEAPAAHVLRDPAAGRGEPARRGRGDGEARRQGDGAWNKPSGDVE